MPWFWPLLYTKNVYKATESSIIYLKKTEYHTNSNFRRHPPDNAVSKGSDNGNGNIVFLLQNLDSLNLRSCQRIEFSGVLTNLKENSLPLPQENATEIVESVREISFERPARKVYWYSSFSVHWKTMLFSNCSSPSPNLLQVFSKETHFRIWNQIETISRNEGGIALVDKQPRVEEWEILISLEASYNNIIKFFNKIWGAFC